MAFGWLKKAVNAAGKGIGGAVHATASVTGSIGKLAGKIPVVGKGIKGVYDFSINAPFQVANDIAKGTRLDKVALNHIKRQVQDVKDVAPYAKMALSVTGVGAGFGAAIGAGMALAQGQPITKSLLEGVKGALPGGVVAHAAFDLSTAAITGKGLDKAALNALPLSADQKKVVEKGMSAAAAIAKGQKVDPKIVDEAMKLLPPDAAKAMQIGLSVAKGQNIQKAALNVVSTTGLTALSNAGVAIAKGNPVLKAGLDVIKTPAERTGYAVGLGLMSHAISPIDLVAIRNALDATQRLGFDVAISAHMGLNEHGAHPKLAPKAQFAHATTIGMVGNPDTKSKTNAMTLISKDPQARAGAVVAINQVAELRTSSWWRRLLSKLGLLHEAIPAAAKPVLKKAG